MKISRRTILHALGTLPLASLLAAFTACSAKADEPTELPASDPTARTASRSEIFPKPPLSEQHPLLPCVRMAQNALDRLDGVSDYTATLAKRERIDGVLGPYEYLSIKVRHEPFSVYTKFLGPDKLKGQEAIYVAGRNDGKLLGHGTGIKKLAGTLSLDPTSSMAMNGNRYPITEVGIKRLTERLVEEAQADMQYDDAAVRIVPGAKINDRSATLIEVVHPERQPHYRYHIARVFIDDEYQLPVRFEAYDWPNRADGEPPLVEEYSYLKLRFNVGLTDLDFDPKNRNYDF